MQARRGGAWRRAARQAAALALLWPALQPRAEVIDIAWSTGGEYHRSLPVAAGKFAEICGALKAGESVQWQFEADSEVDFNAHFHEGKEVRFPARSDQVLRLQGSLSVDTGQDYCWMWSNQGAAPAQLRVRLRKR